MTIFNRNLRRHALTLVEMLVGMAITLVMMAAVVNLFANISEGVRNRRATMEVSASLRIARARLYNDLAGATCLKFPKDAFGVMPKPDVNNPPDGYFEYVEGQRADEDPGGGIDNATSLVPSSNDPTRFDSKGNPLNPSYVTDGGGRGDYDDILAMTVESTTERFRGKGRGLRPGGDPSNIGTLANKFQDGDWVDMAISSPVAEVVWFATQNPLDRSEGEPGMRKIYRRVVLVAPWYGTETKVIAGTPTTGSDPLLDLVAQGLTTYTQQLAALRAFQQAYDISARLEGGRIVPNTLADLARRENRFEHMPSDFVSATPSLNYPHVFASEGSGYTGPAVQIIRHYLDREIVPATINAALGGNGSIDDFTVTNNGGRYEIPPTLIVTGTTGIIATARPIMRKNADDTWRISDVTYGMAPLAFERSGEDLVLTDVLGFDVQVFDPGAPLYLYGGSIIPPSGRTAFTDPNSTNDAIGSGILTGFGAYVDLGWNNGRLDPSPPTWIPDYNYASIAGAPATLFQQERRLGWHPRQPAGDQVFRGTPATYDTWTTYYETDGFDQNNLDPDNTGTLVGDNNILTGADEGTNGLDDPTYYDSDNNPSTPPIVLTLNGPDDPMESETSTPYPYPLKGVQVKLRVYEPESRQIRETTVTRNLVK